MSKLFAIGGTRGDTDKVDRSSQTRKISAVAKRSYGLAESKPRAPIKQPVQYRYIKVFHELHSLCRKAYGSCESAILLFGTHIKSGEEILGSEKMDITP